MSRQQHRSARRLISLAVLPALALGAAACSSSSTSSSSGGSTTGAASAPVTASFSGSGPSSLQSLASAGQSAASAAASSAGARASAFAASASAEAARSRSAYQAALAPVSGQGDAISSVVLTGVPKDQSGGLNAAVVTITNSTGAAASYAVQVDWIDPSGQVADSDIVGTENLAPGARAQPIAVTVKSPEQSLSPKVAKAQRF
ncbi:hypothetical protein ACFYNO_38255 [Kitasatospora sp. NPDC006697]|uniref:hypothetical protein n=1 Tax=Kitasatospora sp. NPDC006697 TaxID=3364020 RepID=UPI0036AEC409